MNWILPTLLLSISINAHAYEYASGDWKVISEEEDFFLGVPSCRAFTEKSSANSPFQFSISFPKEYIKAPVAVLSLSPELQGEKVELRLREATEIALPLKITAGEGLAPYWYIPLNMDHMIDRVINAHNLELAIYKEGVENRIQVSLSGSFRTLQASLTCLNKTELYLPQFFKELNDPEIKPLAVNGAITPDRLNDLFNMSYTFFKTKNELSVELETLRNQNSESLQKEKAADERYTLAELKLSYAKRDALLKENAIASIKKEKSSNEEEVKKLDELLKSNDEEKGRLYVAIAPIQLKLNENQLETNTALFALDSVTARLNGSLDALAEHESLLAGQVETVNQLSLKETKLSADIASLQEQLIGHVETLKNYHVDSEISTLIQQNPRVGAAGAEAAALKTKIAPLESQVRDAKIIQIEAQREFERCRRENLSGENTSTSGGIFCEVQIAALQKAQSEFSYLQGELRHLNGQISKLEKEVDDIKQSIRSAVLAEWDRLDGVVKTFEELIGKNENSLRLTQIKKVDFLTSLIPATEREISALQEAIRKYESEKDSYETLLTTLKLRKEDFVRSSGIEGLRAELEKVNQTHAELESKRNQVLAAIEALNLKINAQLESAQILSVQINELTADYQSAKEDYELIHSSLKEFRERDAELESGLKQVTQQYAQARSHYRYIHSQLLGVEAALP